MTSETKKNLRKTEQLKINAQLNHVMSVEKRIVWSHTICHFHLPAPSQFNSFIARTHILIAILTSFLFGFYNWKNSEQKRISLKEIRNAGNSARDISTVVWTVELFKNSHNQCNHFDSWHLMWICDTNVICQLFEKCKCQNKNKKHSVNQSYILLL